MATCTAVAVAGDAVAAVDTADAGTVAADAVVAEAVAEDAAVGDVVGDAVGVAGAAAVADSCHRPTNVIRTGVSAAGTFLARACAAVEAAPTICSFFLAKVWEAATVPGTGTTDPVEVEEVVVQLEWAGVVVARRSVLVLAARVDLRAVVFGMCLSTAKGVEEHEICSGPSPIACSSGET